LLGITGEEEDDDDDDDDENLAYLNVEGNDSL